MNNPFTIFLGLFILSAMAMAALGGCFQSPSLLLSMLAAMVAAGVAVRFWQQMAQCGLVRQRDKQDLRLAANVFANSQNGIVMVDAQYRIIDVNPAFIRMTDYHREEALGQDPRLFCSDRQDAAFLAQMWQVIQATGAWQGEFWILCKSGESVASILSISTLTHEAGHFQYYLGIFSDITQIKKHEAELEHIAFFDPLTGVPNRRLMVDRLSQALAHVQRSGRRLAVCYLDLDGFKRINDSLGQDAGDQLLMEIASRLQS
ncbi:MAG: diguanylate cyclase, partial [Pseudomonadota bacterium]